MDRRNIAYLLLYLPIMATLMLSLYAHVRIGDLEASNADLWAKVADNEHQLKIANNKLDDVGRSSSQALISTERLWESTVALVGNRYAKVTDRLSRLEEDVKSIKGKVVVE